MLAKNHFPDECIVEIDGSLSFELLCQEDRQNRTELGIIPGTEPRKSALGKSFRLLGLQLLLTGRKIEEASKTDNGKKNVLSKLLDVSDTQKCKEIEVEQNQQESETSVVLSTTAADDSSLSAPVTKSKCNADFSVFKFIYSKNALTKKFASLPRTDVK